MEFWSFWGGGPRRETIESIIEDFNNSQDDIEVTHVYQPWGDIWTKALAAVASCNDIPDIIVQDINTVRQRADANQATNLQEYLDQEEENISDSFYPQLWDTVVHEDEAYGLPFNTDTHVLFYNKDLFDEAGLEYPDPENPYTYDEFVEVCKKLTKDTDGDGEIDQWGAGFANAFMLHQFIWSNGASFTSDDYKTITIDTPEFKEALQKYVDLTLVH